MAQHYSNSRREHDPWTLPDIETFWVGADEFNIDDDSTWMHERLVEALRDRGIDADIYLDDADPAADDDEWQTLHDVKQELRGWYWWSCLPGYLPDSDASGPFDSEAEALADARDGMDFDDDEKETP